MLCSACQPTLALALSAYLRQQQNDNIMTRGNTILLAALGGAAVAALLANFLTTEKGRQLLQTATSTLKDLSAQATEYAKTNLGEVLNETKNSVGDVVKQKLSEQFAKQQ